MSRTNLSLAIIAVLFGAVHITTWDNASAQEFRKLQGEYVVGKPDGGSEAEFGLIITGVAAQKIYNGLTVNAVEDLCTGGMRKDHPTGMHCIQDGNEYTCSFGYKLTSGQTTPGPLTC